MTDMVTCNPLLSHWLLLSASFENGVIQFVFPFKESAICSITPKKSKVKLVGVFTLSSAFGCSFRKTDTSCLTWEGEGFCGKNAILQKLTQLPFEKVQHSITAEDHQPTPDSCVISMVVGQVKVDNDPVMGFHQLFHLKNVNSKWICTNDMFRLSLHNFG
ncbi:nuclear transport factor 2-like isoform X1 [Polypterus senegalus]|uniref:nuclear transport factor 2-like isoform X1 n=1 Tax=Polypterus senegalus TaxID=55291 RepID=UPI0019626291|nr:nuclear transport factor 2-like isoform X1 [Polypterus senegalus]